MLFEIIEQQPSKKAILFEIPSIDIDEIHHNPKGAGRKPKNFYALVKAFLGVSYMGLKNSPDVVYSQLINDLVDLVPFYCFNHNMQQSGTAATQYIVVFCNSLILNQQSH